MGEASGFRSGAFLKTIVRAKQSGRNGMFDVALSRIDSLLASSEGTESQRPHRNAALVFVGFVVAYVIVRGLAGAAQRPLWFDEFLTLAVAGQPRFQGVWKALARGFDTQAPGFYLIEHIALGIMSNKQIALRLPSIAAFPCTVICVFALARKRSGELVACICVLLLFSTSLYHTYLIEARAYGMMIACVAFALVCYQRMPSYLWAAMLGISFVVAGSLHYYYVFSMVPFGLAEAAMLFRTRRFRWPVWTALACGMLPLIVFWHLLMVIRTYYGTHIFSRPSFAAVRTFYESFLLLNDNPLAIATAVIAVLGITWSYLWQHTEDPQRPDVDDQTISEGILLLSLIALPFIVFIIIRLAHGALLSRYVMAATIGLVLGIALAVSIAGRKATILCAVFVCCLVGVRESTFWFHPEFDAFIPPFSATTVSELQHMTQSMQNAGHADLPIVVSNCLLYSQFVYYSKPDWTSRLVYLADEQREIRYTASDTVSRTLTGLSQFFPLHVVAYSEFTAAHPEFLLYSEGLDWYMPAFLGSGFSLQLVANDHGQIYLVKTKGASTH
jgi:hypothetical protein